MLFEGQEILEEFNEPSDRKLIKIVKDQKPDHVMLSSVKKGVNRLVKELTKFVPVELLSHKTPLPFKNNYKTPESLGMDRLAAVAGAYFNYPRQNCLVIDAGTCITYDFIDASGQYHGGGISPGLHMKLKALKKFTSKLPLIAFRPDVELIGKNTKESILSGVVNGTLAEIEGVINRYQQFYNDLIIIICGGDSNFFESKLKGRIFAEPKLVLIGLNRILLNNVRN